MSRRNTSQDFPLGIDTSRTSGSLEFTPGVETASNSEEAFLNIDFVLPNPSDPIRGEDEVEVQVQVTDESGSNADWVRAFVVVEADTLDNPVLQKCTYMDPGETIVVDDGDAGGALDGEFIIEEDTTFNVTAGAVPEGVHCDAIRRSGVVTDTATERVETRPPPPPLNTSISEVPENPTACPGSEVDLTFEVTNSGDFGAIRTTFINEDIGQREQQISTAQAAPEPGVKNWKKEFTYTTSLPEGASRGRVKFILEQNPGGYTWTGTGRESVSIDAGEPELLVRNISGPNSACVGSGGTITAEVFSNSTCEATGKAKLVNDFNSQQIESEQFNIQPGSSQEVSFDFQLPGNANDDIDYEVLAFTMVEGSFEETGDAETTVVAINPELEIVDTTVTEFRCVGNPVNISTVVSNPEICPQQARVIVTNNKDEQQVTLGPKTLEPQTNARFETQLKLPDNAVLSDEVEYRVTVQTDIGGSWVTSDDDDEGVEIGKAEFTATDFTLPAFAQPGQEVGGSVTYENDGECPGTITVTNTAGEDLSKLVQPNSTVSYNFSFTMGAEGEPVDITASYEEAGRIQDELSGLVRVHKTIVIDTEQGSLKIYGGFDSNTSYEGVMQAEEISGDSLEEEDSLRGILRLGRFQGVSTTQSTDIDEFTFSNMQFLNMSTGRPVQWVVDGEIQGVSKSFEYRSFSRNPLSRPSNLPSSNPELFVAYNPARRVGTILRGLRRE